MIPATPLLEKQPDPITNIVLWSTAQSWANKLNRKTGVLSIMRTASWVAYIVLGSFLLTTSSVSLAEQEEHTTETVIEEVTKTRSQRVKDFLAAKKDKLKGWVVNKSDSDVQIAKLTARLKVADERILELQRESENKDSKGYELWLDSLEAVATMRKFLELNRPTSLGVTHATEQPAKERPE